MGRPRKKYIELRSHRKQENGDQRRNTHANTCVVRGCAVPNGFLSRHRATKESKESRNSIRVCIMHQYGIGDRVKGQSCVFLICKNSPAALIKRATFNIRANEPLLITAGTLPIMNETVPHLDHFSILSPGGSFGGAAIFGYFNQKQTKMPNTRRKKIQKRFPWK